MNCNKTSSDSWILYVLLDLVCILVCIEFDSVEDSRYLSFIYIYIYISSFTVIFKSVYISSFTVIFKSVNNTSIKIGVVSVKLRDRLVNNIIPLLLYKEEVL